jgi:hypothetical protein
MIGMNTINATGLTGARRARRNGVFCTDIA